MVDYDGKLWRNVLLRWRGTVLPGLLPRLAAVAAVGTIAAWSYARHGAKLSGVVHALVGVALGLLLVFRTNTSYDRYWEGRRLFGSIVNRTRDLARQVMTLVDGDEGKADLLRLVRALSALVRQFVRRERDLAPHGELLTAGERAALDGVACRPVVVAAWISGRLAALARAGHTTEHRLALMDANVTALVDAWGGAERILKTPIPLAYAHHIKAFLALFCFTLPFALVDALGWYTPVAATLVAFGLFGIEEIGVEIEDPFGHDANDLPIDRIGETIDGDVQALGKLT